MMRMSQVQVGKGIALVDATATRHVNAYMPRPTFVVYFSSTTRVDQLWPVSTEKRRCFHRLRPTTFFPHAPKRYPCSRTHLEFFILHPFPLPFALWPPFFLPAFVPAIYWTFPRASDKSLRGKERPRRCLAMSLRRVESPTAHST